MTNTNSEQKELTTKEKLNLETAVLTWKEVEVYFAQGKLLIVDPSCDLIDVAVQITGKMSDNDISQLEQIIEKNLIQFPTPDWIRKNCNDQTLLWTLVIAPYVISQLKSK